MCYHLIGDFMSEVQNLNDYYKSRKGFAGYRETIRQYTGRGENIVVNLHSNNHMNFHTHDFFEINYIKKGNCTNLFEGGSVDMQEGDLILIHPDAMHSLYVDDKSLVYNFIISKAYLFNLISQIKHCENTAFDDFIKRLRKENSPSYLFIKSTPETKRLLDDIVSVKKQINKSLYLECLIGQLLLTCASDTDNVFLANTTIEGRDVLKNILAKMEGEYKTVSLDSISKDFGYSKAHVCKLFKKHYNSTFSAKLNEIKILRAKKMLLDTNMSIADISCELGFESTEYFHRLFKKELGLTPNQYRSAQPSSI